MNYCFELINLEPYKFFRTNRWFRFHLQSRKFLCAFWTIENWLCLYIKWWIVCFVFVSYFSEMDCAYVNGVWFFFCLVVQFLAMTIKYDHIFQLKLSLIYAFYTFFLLLLKWHLPQFLFFVSIDVFVALFPFPCLFLYILFLPLLMHTVTVIV